jgi:hypothetical protein
VELAGGFNSFGDAGASHGSCHLDDGACDGMIDGVVFDVSGLV